jgi:hypothetical protein
MATLDDLSTTAGNWAGIAIGTGIAVAGSNAVMGQLNRLNKPSKRKKHKVVYRKTFIPYPKSGKKGNLSFESVF